MKLINLFLSITLALSIIACDDDDSGGTITLEAFSLQISEKYCSRYDDCCSTNGNWDATEYESYDDCVEQASSEFLDDYQNDRIIVNESKLKTAYDSYSRYLQTDCTQITDDEVIIEVWTDLFSSFEPAQNLGDYCEDDFECKDSYCHSDLGECTAYAEMDEDCSENRCVDGARCKEGVCVELLQEGDDCESPDSYPNCYGGDELYCNQETIKCEKTKENGEDCTTDEQCKSWFCDPDTSKCANEWEEEEETFEEFICPEADMA
ncbi:MAG: hypothetical protein PF689_08870 [Deltaproteobacteria bacterium]|jgi:hypothetical protein|nr:hypothetical protein [Deltaproteobacteria bacterium]